MPSVLLQKVKSLIGSINIVGEEPNFKIQGFSRVPSPISILLSVIGIGFIGFISYLFLSESFDLTKPDVNIELRTLSNYPKVPLGKENILFAMIRRNPMMSPNSNPAALDTVIAEINLKTFRKNANGETMPASFEKFRLDTVQCSQVRDDFSYLANTSVGEAMFERGICFKPKEGQLDQYFLQGHPLEEINSSLDISVWPCSLSDPTKCASSQIFSRGQYTIVMPSPDVDLSKPDDFFQWVALAGDMNDADAGTKQQFYSKFKKYSIYDKTSIFSEVEHRKDYFQIDDTYVKSFYRDRNQVHCPASAIGNRALCQPYIEMKFSSSNKEETITRLYPSFLRALSEIGGFTELIMMFIGFLYGVYNAWFNEMRSFLVKNVFARGEKIGSCSGDKKGYGKVVEDNLDIVEVMKELNGLRLLNRAIFKDHHLTLLPEVLSKIKDEESKEGEDKNDKPKVKNKEMAKKGAKDRGLSNNKISPLKSKLSNHIFSENIGLRNNNNIVVNSPKIESARSIRLGDRRDSGFLKRGMTITKKPERKTSSDAIEDLKNSTPVSEFEHLLNNLFLNYLQTNKNVSRDEAKAAEAIQKSKLIMKPNKQLVKQKDDSALQKYLKRRNSARGSSSPRMSSFKRISMLHGKKKAMSRFNKDSPRGTSTKKFEFVEIESENEKSEKQSVLN